MIDGHHVAVEGGQDGVGRGGIDVGNQGGGNEGKKWKSKHKNLLRTARCTFIVFPALFAMLNLFAILAVFALL
jgi:hypothetical protein